MRRFLYGTLLFALVGCGPATPPGPAKPTKPTTTEVDDHDHGPGPHGGTVIEFGKYHGEFTVDHSKKQVTIYILDGNVKGAVPIAVEKLLLSIKTPTFQVDLKPLPQESDPKGKASRFVATDDRFGKEQEFAGTLSGILDGKQYLGDFAEKAEHEHKKQ